MQSGGKQFHFDYSLLVVSGRPMTGSVRFLISIRVMEALFPLAGKIRTVFWGAYGRRRALHRFGGEAFRFRASLERRQCLPFGHRDDIGRRKKRTAARQHVRDVAVDVNGFRVPAPIKRREADPLATEEIARSEDEQEFAGPGERHVDALEPGDERTETAVPIAAVPRHAYENVVALLSLESVNCFDPARQMAKLELANLSQKKCLLLSVECDNASRFRDRITFGGELSVKTCVKVLQCTEDELGLKRIHAARACLFIGEEIPRGR